MSSQELNYKFYSSTALWYKDVIEDIAKAQKYIYIESFRIADDEVGQELSDALIASHQRGVHVKILADWWGTGTNNNCLKKLQSANLILGGRKQLKISTKIVESELKESMLLF